MDPLKEIEYAVCGDLIIIYTQSHLLLEGTYKFERSLGTLQP